MNRRTFLVSATVSSTAIILAGCTGSSGPETPDEVTEAFINALLDGDYETSQSFIHGDLEDEITRTFVAEQEAYAERADGEISSIEVVDQTDNQAQVDAITTADTGLGAMTTHLEFELTNEEGEWIITSFESV